MKSKSVSGAFVQWRKDQDSCGTKTLFDVLIAAYLLNPLKNDYEPEDIAKEQLDRMIRTRKQLFEKLSLKEAYAQRPEEFYEYAGTLAYVCYAAVPVLSQNWKKPGCRSCLTKLRCRYPVCFMRWKRGRAGTQTGAAGIR